MGTNTMRYKTQLVDLIDKLSRDDPNHWMRLSFNTATKEVALFTFDLADGYMEVHVHEDTPSFWAELENRVYKRPVTQGVYEAIKNSFVIGMRTFQAPMWERLKANAEAVAGH